MAAASKDRDFKNHANTQEEEDSYDYVQFREGIRPTSVIGAIAHIVKGALGGGIMGGPVAYSKAGILVAIPITISVGIYMGYCMYLLVVCTQILLKRTRKPFLSYADCGEAAMMLFPIKKVARFAKAFRYTIDTLICVDLFGACCTYQLIIAKSLKQLVEMNAETRLEGIPGYPHLRVYLAIMIPFFVMICLITQLKYLVPFSLGANCVILAAVFIVIYYCFQNNPGFEGLAMSTNFEGTLQFVGMSVFAMSCAGIVIPVEGNMKNPKQFGVALAIGITPHQRRLLSFSEGWLHSATVLPFASALKHMCFSISLSLWGNCPQPYGPWPFTQEKYWPFISTVGCVGVAAASAKILKSRQGAIIVCILATSLFGYAAFKEKIEAPFTINFPMTTVPIIFKAAICVMLYVTHALNFWVPFNLCWYYLKKRFETRPMLWERIFRSIFVVMIGIIGIAFPNITGLMGFIGCFCLSNMAMIWPSIISILVFYERPGYGRYKWRLWRAIFFIIIGTFILICGSIVNMKALLSVFK